MSDVEFSEEEQLRRQLPVERFEEPAGMLKLIVRARLARTKRGAQWVLLGIVVIAAILTVVIFAAARGGGDAVDTASPSVPSFRGEVSDDFAEFTL